MLITFISECKNKAHQTTRRILSRFAKQIGHSTWQSKFTKEGLEEVIKELRLSASKETCIAIFRYVGTKKSKLIDRIGKPLHTEDGRYPCAQRLTNFKTMRTKATNMVSLAAEAAGLVHDIGKANQYFQNKLKGLRTASDPVRHEWLSLLLLQEMRQGLSLKAAWNKLAQSPLSQLKQVYVDGVKRPVHEFGFNGLQSSLDYLVATHHKLFEQQDTEQVTARNEKSGYALSAGGFVRPYREVAEFNEALTGLECPQISACIQDYVRKSNRLENELKDCDPKTARALAYFARICLVLADHLVSAKQYPFATVKDETVFANTNENGEFNQPLHWHLREVGTLAGRMPALMNDLGNNLPAMSEDTLETIKQKKATSDRFVWQDTLVEHLESLSDKPCLIFNLAGTGAGKTLTNIKAVTAARKSGPQRISLGLNLRTLTHQSGQALQKDLGIESDQIATLIGDEASKVLFSQAVQEDLDGNQIESPVISYGTDRSVPDFLKSAYKSRSDRIVLTTPILVSTLDYLVDAGDPTKQARQYKAALRVMNSDLIIDEIDSLDTQALIAICRVIELAGAYGRNVVVSSASISEVLAAQISSAYFNGLSMKTCLGDNPAKAHLVIAHDKSTPKSMALDKSTLKDVPGFCQKKIDEALKPITNSPAFRVAKTVKLSDLPYAPKSFMQGWTSLALQSIQELHRDNHTLSACGKRVSFGFVRLANIKQIRQFCTAMDQADLPVKYFAYHSEDLLINRHQKSSFLTQVLTRKGTAPNHALLNHPAIKQHLENADTDLILVAVASPVEEVGQDHDFDWGVFDLSSSGSLVQAAGRINRHRLIPVTKPNIHLLNMNMRLCSELDRLQFNPEALKPTDVPWNKLKVFAWPGPETRNRLELDSSKRPKIVSAMISNDPVFSINASLRLGSTKCTLAKAEDELLNRELTAVYGQTTGVLAAAGNAAMCADFYCHNSLRSRQPNDDRQIGFFEITGKEPKAFEYRYANEELIKSKIRVSIQDQGFKGLFDDSIEDLNQLARQLSHQNPRLYEQLMGFNVRPKEESFGLTFSLNKGFV